MKKILKNKKGFTLVELLAVIVILAIIMVIATQQIGKVISGARADSFVESYQMVERQVKTYISSDQTNLIECDDWATKTESGNIVKDTTEYCSTKGNYSLASNDYFLKVKKNGSKYEITLSAKHNLKDTGETPAGTDGDPINYEGKFATLNLNTSGKASNGTSCVKTKISSGVTSCNDKKIVGSVDING